MAEIARRVGLLGGTFDPVHVGHLVAAVNVRAELELDEVLLVVANEPWQKLAAGPLTPAADRLALVEAVLEGVEGVRACSLEIDRGGLSYTIDTVNQLRGLEPQSELFLIVGADVVAGLRTWQRPDELAKLVTLVVVNRPGGFPVRASSEWRVREVEIPGLEISSTDLRERARTGRPLEYLIPQAGIRVIHERGLYARKR